MLVGGRTNLHDASGFENGMEVVASRQNQDAAVYRKAPRRLGHTVTRLADGRVAIIGGTEADAPMKSQSTFVYDPKADAWTFPTDNHDAPPVHHAAALLADGRVLLA